MLDILCNSRVVAAAQQQLGASTRSSTAALRITLEIVYFHHIY
jgi:hypothetical protein